MYRWSLIGGTKVAEIHKKDKTDKYQKYSDLFIDKVKKNNEIKNPKLKNVHTKDKLEKIIKDSKIPRVKKQELLDALDVVINNDSDEINIEGKKLSFPDNKYCLKPIKREYDGSDRECIYISGISGTGKSVWISDYIENYKNKHPDHSVVVFSNQREDPTLDHHQLIRIDNENLVENPITDLNELENTLCIFDDTAAISDKLINKTVQKVRDLVLESGRHHNISCLTVSHISMDGRNTIFPIRESHYVTVFPEGNEKPTENLLRTYCGFGKKGNTEVLDNMCDRQHSRWSTISRRAPRFVLFKRSATLL